MRTIKYFLKNELVDEVPFTAHDYQALIDDLESEITDRRKTEALISVEGKAWLVVKYNEIEAIRQEARAHLGNNWWEQQ